MFLQRECLVAITLLDAEIKQDTPHQLSSLMDSNWGRDLLSVGTDRPAQAPVTKTFPER